MIEDKVIDKILSISDEETGGDNALDGFEFQVSSAIFLIFKEIHNRRDFSLIYEKIEDFIIINDIVNLYQSKSINNNLTPNVLFSPSRKTKNDSSGLSIIEKMYINYQKVLNKIPNCSISTTLIMCENQTFSKKLSSDLKNIEKMENINFKDLSQNAKEQIIAKTQFDDYNWEAISAHRLIPKSRHEEVTRIFIEDVITEILGENKINSSALYSTLTYEIRRIRKAKTKLTRNILMDKISIFSELSSHLDIKNYSNFLSEQDSRSIKVLNSFNQIQNNLLIDNHPNKTDFNTIKEIVTEQEFDNVDDILIMIEQSSKCTLLNIRLKRHEIVALILIVLAKEVIK